VLLLLGTTTISLFLHDPTDAGIILAIVLAGWGMRTEAS
jgi:hypothetical protein